MKLEDFKINQLYTLSKNVFGEDLEVRVTYATPDSAILNGTQKGVTVTLNKKNFERVSKNLTLKETPVEFVKYDSKEIIPEGLYWVITQRKHGRGYLSAKIPETNNKMSVDISNQTCIMRSKNKIT